MEYQEFSAKTVSDAITDACQKLGVTSDRLDYQVVEEGSNGFLGIGAKPALIRARVRQEEKREESSVEISGGSKADTSKGTAKKDAPDGKLESENTGSAATIRSGSNENLAEVASKFLSEVLGAMSMDDAEVEVSYDEEAKNMMIELTGSDMGLLIGKRGATLDSLQYLVSLVVNKESEEYIRVKVDTENYRARRKETLENLARNCASKVKRTGQTVELEPMNPYERRIIHSALQDNRYVETFSEGDEPNRHVVVKLKEGVRVDSYRSGGRYGNGRGRRY